MTTATRTRKTAAKRFKRAPETVESVAARLRAIRANASAEHVAEGTRWYPEAGAMIADMAEEFGVSREFATGVFAAYSQNSTWKANQTMARRYLRDRLAFGLRDVQLEVCDMEAGVHPRDAIGGLKRPDFYSNMMGDLEPTTNDRHHLDAGFGHKVALTPEVHAMSSEATAIVAAEFGEAPATCQAIIWCAVRGTGA